MNRLLACFVLCLAFTVYICAEDSFGKKTEQDIRAATETRDSFSGLDLTAIQLPNGMRVLLRPTSEEPGEVQIRLFAKGGYAAIPGVDDGLAKAALQIGWESGIGESSTDKQAVMLYEHSLEFIPYIEKNYRIIEGSSPVESLEAFLRLVCDYFTHKRFDKSRFEVTANHSKQVLKETSSIKGNRNCEIAQQLYEESFRDPSEFVCIVVGDFTITQAEKIVVSLLGEIPLPSHPKRWGAVETADFSTLYLPEKSMFKISGDCIAKITFPVEYGLRPEQMLAFKLGCKVIEKRLNDTLADQCSHSAPANIEGEFPLYPSLKTVWMTVRLRCCHKEIEKRIQSVVAVIEQMHRDGPLPSEVEEARKQLIECRMQMVNGCEFWLTSLTNAVLWEVPFESINAPLAGGEALFEEVKKILQDHLNTKRYVSTSTKISARS